MSHLDRFTVYLIVNLFVILCFCQNIGHASQFRWGRLEREALVVSNVKSDKNFVLEQNVSSWKTISAGEKTHAVGLMETGVAILNVKVNKANYTIDQEVFAINSTLVDFELFAYWNEHTQTSDVDLILGTYNETFELVWFKIYGTKLEELQKLQIYRNVTHLSTFKLADDKPILSVTTATDENTISLDLYALDFSQGKQNLWLLQSIPLDEPTNVVTTNTFGPTTYLAISQRAQATILIFKYASGHFKPYQNITASNVVQLSSFKIGFKPFLAVASDSASVYQFTSKGLLEQKLETRLGKVDFWLPILINNYRQDVVLLAQKVVPHDGYTSHCVEVLMYNGKQFVTHDEISCTYLGEKEFGLTCMIDGEKKGGLFGSVALNLGKSAGVLVPMTEHSVLFTLETNLKKVENPIDTQRKQTIEIKERLQKLIDERTKREIPWNFQMESAASIQENLSQLQQLRNEVLAVRSAIDDVKLQLQNTVLLNETEHVFKQLVVNGNVKVLGQTTFKSIVTQTLNGDSPKDVIGDLVRKDSNLPIASPKTFFDLQADTLTFEKLNDVDAERYLTLSSGDLTFKKPVRVKNNVVVNSGEVNGKVLADEVVLTNKVYKGSLTFENIQVEDELQMVLLNEAAPPKLTSHRGDSNTNEQTLEIEELAIFGNVVVDEVNGDNFAHFLDSLCFTNRETTITGEVVLDGDLNVRSEASSQFLNNLRFPEEYAIIGREHTIVTGNKFFADTTVADRILSLGTINGVLVDNIVTSDLDQTVSGNYTFENIEIVRLDVNGTIENEHVKNLKPNPTLREVRNISARVKFRELKVEGNVIVSGEYDGVVLSDALSDVVYKDEKEAVITSIKNLVSGLTVNKGINVNSNSLNEISLDTLVTTKTEQELSFETLNGSVSFEDLYLSGLFDGVDIPKLVDETVKLDGDQFVSSTLEFVNNDDKFIDLTATDFSILNTLNNLTSEEYFYKNGADRRFTGDVHLDIIVAENVEVNGNISGPIFSLEDFSLEEFDTTRLSLTQPRAITSEYVVKNLICDHFQTGTFNGAPFQNMFDYDSYAEAIANKLISGELSVENLIVNGSVEATILNGKNVNTTLTNYVWTDKDNKLNTAIFYEDVVFQNLKLEHLNGIAFDQMIEDVVLKTEINPIISSPKRFFDGIYVGKFLNAERINGIHVDHVWRKTGNQVLLGPLYVEGDVTIASNCEVDENLNTVPMEHLKKTYQFPDDSTCVVNGDLMMKRLQYVDHMIVQGAINGENLEEFLSNLVLTSSNALFEHNFEFRKHVKVKQNFVVQNLINGVDLSDFEEDMVFITKDEIIDGGIIFTAPVTIKEELYVTKNLLSKEICGIDLSKWLDDAVLINRGRIPGKTIFQSATIHEYLNLNFINDVDLTTLIPLRTDQRIDASLSFTEITPFHEITVGGFVNGHNLAKEYQNSLQVNKRSQTISSKVTFNENVMVWDSLRMSGLLNSNELGKIVTTKTEQILGSMFTFIGNATFEQLQIRGLVNKLNVTQWNEGGVKTYSAQPQVMENSWNVLENVTFVQNTESSSLIGGMDVVKLKLQIDERHSNGKLSASGAMADYIKVCHEVNQIAEKVQKQPFLFKYLEHVRDLDFRFDWDVKKAFPFEHDNEKYLLISFRNICTTNLYIWEELQFKSLELLEMGSIAQIIPIYDDDYSFFVTRNDDLANCKIKGTNLWKFENQAFQAIYTLEHAQLLEKSLIPRTFYALGENLVTEYKIANIVNDVHSYRTWHVNGANMSFVPRGLGTGLALSNGSTIIKLLRENNPTKNDFGYNYDETIRGQIVTEADPFSTGQFKREVVVVNVGLGASRKSLLASTFHEEVVVRGRFDFIKIYDDLRLFHKIPTYKPSSLMSLEFGNNGETLLLFLEDEKFLHVYEYKGIEGFLQRTQIDMEGSSLFSLALPFNKDENKVVGVVHKNEIKFLQALMSGNEIQIEEQHCDLL